MIDRPWDLENHYKDGFLKEYTHWILEISFRQHTLGSFIIFAKRNIENISALNEYELFELKIVMKEIETTLLNIELFKPDRFNYMQMGNTLHHLHFHGIPRYASQRVFDGKIWIDKTWGSPPIWSNNEVSNNFVLNIKNIILQYLPH